MTDLLTYGQTDLRTTYGPYRLRMIFMIVSSIFNYVFILPGLRARIVLHLMAARDTQIQHARARGIDNKQQQGRG